MFPTLPYPHLPVATLSLEGHDVTTKLRVRLGRAKSHGAALLYIHVDVDTLMHIEGLGEESLM